MQIETLRQPAQTMGMLMTREQPRGGAPAGFQPGGTLARELRFASSSYDAQARTVNGVFAAGTPVRRWGFVETLNMDSAAVDLTRIDQGQCKLLNSHNSADINAIIGVVEEARIQNGELVGRVRFAETDSGRKAEGMVARGELTGFSIGYSIKRWTNVSQDDTGVETWRADEWSLLEVTLCAVPADPIAMVRNAPSVGDAAAERAAPSAMTARQTLDLLQRAEFYGQRELAERMIGEGGDEAAIIAAVQAARAAAAPAPIGGPRPSIGNERATIMRSQHNDTISLENPQTRSDAILAAAVAVARDEEPKGAAREFSHLRTWEEFNNAYVGNDRRGSQWGERAGLHTGSDFAILTAATRVFVQDGYQMNVSPMLALAKTIDVPDFKGDTIARISGTGKFLPVAETGEIQGTSRVEEGEKIVPYEYGQQIGYSRKALINSGMRLAADAGFALGKGAANTLSDALADLLKANSGNGATLSDGNATFTTARGNKAASGGAIDITTLSAARLSIRQRKEPDNVTPIKLTPWGLLTGPNYETIALQYTSSAYVPSQPSVVNPFAGKLETLIDQRITGNAWYLFAAPSEAAMFTIAYLNGRRTPIVEERQGWDVLGTEYRGVFDFGVAITDWRPGYYNPGA